MLRSILDRAEPRTSPDLQGNAMHSFRCLERFLKKPAGVLLVTGAQLTRYVASLVIYFRRPLLVRPIKLFGLGKIRIGLFLFALTTFENPSSEKRGRQVLVEGGGLVVALHRIADLARSFVSAA